MSQLVRDYKYTSHLSNSISGLMLMGLFRIASGLISVIIMITVLGLNLYLTPMIKPSLTAWVIDSVVLIGLGLVGFFQVYGIIRDAYRVVFFSKYESKVRAQIKKLGGNPEELLKEDSGG